MTVTRYAPHVEATPERPLGAQLSRRWRKHECLLAQRDLLYRAACGDWEQRVAEIEKTLDTEVTG